MALPRIVRIGAWTLGGLLLTVVAGAGIIVATFDTEAQKPRIIAAVKQATGRDLALKGRIGLALSLRPTLEIADIVLSNPPGFSRPDMLTLEKVDLQLALLPLLSRRIEINRLILTRPEVRLETNAKGESNWVFTPEQPASPPAPDGASGGASGKSPPMAFAVQNLRLDNGFFSHHDAKISKTTSLTIKQIATAAPGLDAPLHLTAVVTVEKTDIALTLDTGPLNGLTNPGGAWPIKVVVETGGARIAAEGGIARPAAGEGVDLALSADIPDLAALSALAQQDLPPLKAIALRTRIAGDAKGVTLSGLTFTSSAGDLAGELSLKPGVPPSIKAVLTSTRFDADALLKESDKAAKAPKPPNAAGGGAKPGHVIPDEPLPFGQLQMVDADIRLKAGTLHLGGADYKSIEAHAVLRDGALKLDPASADLPQGHIAMTLAVDAAQATPPVHLTAHAPGIALQGLLAALGQPAFASGNLEVQADLHGAGVTPHAIAASLDGRLGLAVPTGTLDIRSVGGSAGGVLRTLNPKLLNSNADALRCFAVRLDFVKGLGTFRALVLASGSVNADGGGTINLDNEELAVNLRSQAVIAGVAVTAPVHISGPLAAPRTKVDEVGIAGANAAALGGLLGAGKTAAVADACPGALALARGQGGQAAASPGEPPVSAPPAAPSAEQPAPQPKPPAPAQMLRQLFR